LLCAARLAGHRLEFLACGVESGGAGISLQSWRVLSDCMATSARAAVAGADGFHFVGTAGFDF